MSAFRIAIERVVDGRRVVTLLDADASRLAAEVVLALEGPGDVVAIRATTPAAGPEASVLVTLPDSLAGGQVHVEAWASADPRASWRTSPWASWSPVAHLGGTVEKAP